MKSFKSLHGAMVATVNLYQAGLGFVEATVLETTGREGQNFARELIDEAIVEPTVGAFETVVRAATEETVMRGIGIVRRVARAELAMTRLGFNVLAGALRVVTPDRVEEWKERLEANAAPIKSAAEAFSEATLAYDTDGAVSEVMMTPVNRRRSEPPAGATPEPVGPGAPVELVSVDRPEVSAREMLYGPRHWDE